VGDVLRAKEKRARLRLYGLIANVEGHLTFEDVEAFILEVMDVEHALALRNEYLY
jgi:hypothetical protein